MTPERWRRVGELFHEALEVAPAERTIWACRACESDPELHRELVSLLENDRAIAGGFIQDQVKSAVVGFYEPGGVAPLERRIGHYKLVRELGRGGMGTVYLAERDDEQYSAQVAIKLVRPDMDTAVILHRFRRERQILAHLEHPNIARLLDGGTTEEGLPYIVMEYIAGVSITEYCDAHGLDIAGRLRIFLDVCAAVEYAHRHFVVHRDLKPGNILISETGIAKLLDFGICKLLPLDAISREETRTKTLQMFTPEYASPEQILGEPVTIVSDVYSLGAVLYELLTGYKAHRIDKLTPRAIEHAICECDVIRPSLVPNQALARSLSGDLDNILLVALQKDPQRRYSSVEQFSEDIRRHLSYEPVRARADTLAYRIRKFARRRRGATVAATLIFASLLAGVTVAWREVRIAQAALLDVRRLANVFVFDVHDAVRDLPGSTRARQLIAATGLKYLDTLANNSRRDWQLKNELATAYQRIGDVQGYVAGANLGDTKAALESYRKALVLLDAVIAHDSGQRTPRLARLTVQQRIGSVYLYTQDTQHALANLGEAQKSGENLLAQSPGDGEVAKRLALIYVATGDVLWISGAFADSMSAHAKAVALVQKLQVRDPHDRLLQQIMASAYSAIGMDQTRLGHLEGALDCYRRSLAILQEITREDPSNASYQRILMSVYSHLGDALGNPKWRNLGDAAGALNAYRQMSNVARRLYEIDPENQQAVSDYAIALSRVAAGLPARSLPERVRMLRESLALLLKVRQVNPRNTMNRWDLCHGYGLIGDALMESHRPADAIAAYEESASLGEALLAEGVNLPSPDLVSAYKNLGLVAAHRADRGKALQVARRALAISDAAGAFAKDRAPGVQRYLTPRGSAAMGLVYSALTRAPGAAPGQAREDCREATSWLEKSLESWRAVESDLAFAPPHRTEMRQVEQALTGMKARRTNP